MQPNAELCPPDIRYDIAMYLERGQPPGNFLFQVLANNLREAIAGADENNRELLVHIVAYAYNHMPYFSWGSPERVREIIAAGGLRNYCQQQQDNEIHQ